ncbi:sensor protein ZraS [Anaeromyxobacter sp. PSR-1]|nr:sensor protein ZraS [Anaeromyxobacter sp. PSR-1]
MRRVGLVLLLDLVAAAAAGAVLLLALGVPPAARGVLGPARLALLAAAAAAAVIVVGLVLLGRSVARPVGRLLASAQRLGDAGGGLPVLAPPGEPEDRSLARAAVAFERVAEALAEERARLAAKIEELEGANRALAEARASWLRSEQLAAVGRLASGVAHEVGNPLGAIAGYAELAGGRIRAGETAQAEDLVARIAVEAGRIDAIVRDLLELARPTAPAVAPIALSGPVDAALRLARVQARLRQVRADVDLPPGLPPVLADEARLAQVFLNLFLNAGDAMGGRGTLRVAAREVEDAVEVEVADDGPGIAAEDLPRIFDPFFTTKPPGAGTGLGLSVSHGLMEAMGGSISAGVGVSGGAVFRLRLRRGGPRPGPC